MFFLEHSVYIYLGEILMISFKRIYFLKDLKFVRKMQSRQTTQKDQTLATATLFWPLRTCILGLRPAHS